MEEGEDGTEYTERKLGYPMRFDELMKKFGVEFMNLKAFENSEIAPDPDSNLDLAESFNQLRDEFISLKNQFKLFNFHFKQFSEEWDKQTATTSS
jgi:hypothetical protein